MNKKVSVIIPAYNEEKFVARALQSVEDQIFDHSQMEVIVVDNASTDKTSQVCESYFQNNGIPHHLLNEPYLSPGQARNTGAKRASGDVFLFLDADSCLAPRTVGRVYNWYKAGHLMGTIRILPDSSDITAKCFFDLIHFGKNVFNIAANLGFCSRELFFELEGFNPELRQCEDLDFYQRVKKALKKRGKPWCVIDDAPIYTSTRRMDRFPFKLGYLIILLEWGILGKMGLKRGTYVPYR
jgi:glycosyltransferase involved in cell wall biosynthesis